METRKPSRQIRKGFLAAQQPVAPSQPGQAAPPNSVVKLQQQVFFDAQVFIDANIWGIDKWKQVFVRSKQGKYSRHLPDGNRQPTFHLGQLPEAFRIVVYKYVLEPNEKSKDPERFRLVTY